jgi:hypothetical protein
VLGGEGEQTHYCAGEIHAIGLEEEGDQPEDEGVEGDGLGEGEAEPADALKLVFHLRLAGDRLDLLAEDEADADAGADRAEARADTEGDRLAGRLDPFVGDRGVNWGQVHGRALLC